MEEEKTIKIACVGDSLTQGIGALGWQNGDYTYSYPSQLQEILGDGYEVGNFGKGSSFIYNKDGRDETLWYPNTAEYRNSNKFDPDIVIILLGTNDARAMYSDADADSFRTKLTELVEHYLDMQSSPEVYIVSSISVMHYDQKKLAESASFEPREPRLKKYILPMQHEVAHYLNCKFLNAYDDLYKTFTEEDSFASDKLHPNNYGYLTLAQYIAKNLEL